MKRGIELENKTKNKWMIEMKEIISLRMRLKERKCDHCQGCKMSGTNKNEKWCKLRGTEDVLHNYPLKLMKS